MRRWWERIAPWLTPVLVVVEVVLVWSGVLSLRDAVIIIVVVEVLLAVTVVGRGIAVVRSFRAGRAENRDAWTAAEDALAQLLPRPGARVLLIEARMWVCLVQWLARRRPPGATFGYGRSLRPLIRIVLAMLVVEGAVVEVVLVAILGHRSAWVWVALGLHVYGLIWMGGFLGSLTVLPHEIDDRYLRLRDSVFTTVVVPLASVVSVEQRRRGSSGRSGWKLDDHGGALLAYGDASVRLVLCPDPGVLLGTAPAPEGLRTIDLTADDPAAFVRAVAAARPAGITPAES